MHLKSTQVTICNILPPLLTVLGCVTATLIIANHHFLIFGLNELEVIIGDLYKPHHNIFFAPYISGINFYALIYLIFLSSMPLLHLINKIHRRKTGSDAITSIHSTALPLVFTLFFLFTILQTIGLVNDAQKEFRIYAGKSIEEKYVAITGKQIYLFVRYCRQTLPGFHNARLLTDMDLSKDPGMITHRVLAYFLYPIDIRNIRNGPVDSLILFANRNAIANVPEDFEIRGIFDQSSVVAVKRNIP